MIIVLKPNATEADIEQIVERLTEHGYGADISRGEEITLIGAIGVKPEEKHVVADQLTRLSAVERVVPILKDYKWVSAAYKAGRTKVRVGSAVFGGTKLGIIAGPCSVESREQTLEAARAAKAAGATVLRGGAFKPRTNPYDFQGLGEQGLEILMEAREQTGLPIVSEAMQPGHVELLAERVDMIQIGARSMQNFDLLREAGRTKKPVLLKRGMSARIEEWLNAAEYIAHGGNHQIVLCERGIRTFEMKTRFTLDVSAVPVLREETHLPVIVDPSHAAGMFRLVPPLALAAVAVGADGLMIEIHPHPERALCDGPQALTPRRFAHLMREVEAVAAAVGRSL
jgi:3-deoxy-7-phosphoheptulonate synthase